MEATIPFSSSKGIIVPCSNITLHQCKKDSVLNLIKQSHNTRCTKGWKNKNIVQAIYTTEQTPCLWICQWQHN
jgi:hypothetical protein